MKELTPAKLAAAFRETIIEDKARSIKFKTFFNNLSTDQKQILLNYLLKNEDLDFFKIQGIIEKEQQKRKEQLITDYQGRIEDFQKKIEELKK